MDTTLPYARRNGRAISWSLLTGGSVTIVAGFGIDLLRLGAHQAGRALSAWSWPRRVGPWRLPGSWNTNLR